MAYATQLADAARRSGGFAREAVGLFRSLLGRPSRRLIDRMVVQQNRLLEQGKPAEGVKIIVASAAVLEKLALIPQPNERPEAFSVSAERLSDVRKELKLYMAANFEGTKQNASQPSPVQSMGFEHTK